MQTQQLAHHRHSHLTSKISGFEGTVASTKPSRVGGAFRGTDRPLGSVFRRAHCSSYWSPGTRSPEQSTCSTAGDGVFYSVDFETRTGAATVWPIRGAGTNTRISRLAHAWLLNRRRDQRALTDRQPGPRSFAADSGIRVIKKQEERRSQHGEGHAATSTNARTTGRLFVNRRAYVLPSHAARIGERPLLLLPAQSRQNANTV